LGDSFSREVHADDLSHLVACSDALEGVLEMTRETKDIGWLLFAILNIPFAVIWWIWKLITNPTDAN